MPIGKSDPLISFSISKGMYSEIVDEIVDLSNSNSSHSVYLANAHMTVVAFRDKKYASIIKEADIVTPDGMPLTWALRLLYGIKQQRVCGMDILPELIGKAEKLHIPVFFYGGTENILQSTKRYLQTKFPLLTIAGIYSPPFRDLIVTEANDITHIINDSGAKMVFVILGCPKQEKWIASMKYKIQATMIGIGGALPIMLGLRKRAPLWMQKSGLEWFHRLLQEPRRLFKRYLITNTFFIFLIIKEFIKVRLLRPRTTNL